MLFFLPRYIYLKSVCFLTADFFFPKERGLFGLIEMKNVTKTFRVAKRSAGFSKAVKALFQKEYTDIHALQDVTFTIKDGEMVGYIGPNGAGKSSTIKILSGVLTPDSGSCLAKMAVPEYPFFSA